ncbi:MAG TPA: hypothetical protein VGQ88_02245, partial [Burkholderiales bacterium]|nr:hypothetical protein [Burkholderiales bacterium]
LLASPVLPQHLDPALIDRLPEASGVYVLHGEDNHVLHVGKANNLKSHVQNYFRLDRTSAKALAISHRITNITWRVTLGTLGAQLQHAALSKALLPARKALAGKSAALKPLQLPAWPYAGPIGVRERADLHIIDDWRYLGTANCEADVYSVLQTRPPDFDEEIFALLAKRLPRLSHKQIIQLPGHERTL